MAPTTAFVQFDTTGVLVQGLVVTRAQLCSCTANALTKVILTNARNAMMDFTTSDVSNREYDALFADAFMLALEGKVGDWRCLATAEFTRRNYKRPTYPIINARVRDGNEGLTTYEHVPDWLQVRGVSSMRPSKQLGIIRPMARCLPYSH